jgi:hypothetical protein
MAPNSIDAARAQLAAKRKQRVEWDSNFWPHSDLMDIQIDRPDPIFDPSKPIPVLPNQDVANNVNILLEVNLKPELLRDSMPQLDRKLLQPGVSTIVIKISENMEGNRFLDLQFIKYSSALPNNELLQLSDKKWNIYVWNGKNQPDGSILLIIWERWEKGQMRYNKGYDTKKGTIRLTFNHAKY